MNRLLSIVLIALIGANGWYTWYQLRRAQPDTTILDQDIASIDKEVAEAKSEVGKYNKGLLQVLIQARLEILNTSRAMLDQKRTSVLRSIDLRYTVEGQAWTPATDEQLKAIAADLGAQQAKTKLAEFKADGSGGLIGMMAKLEAQVEQMTEAMLMQRAYAAKYGLPYAPAAARESEEQQEALGKIVPDPDGL